MSATLDRPSLHPILACAESVDAALTEVAAVDATFMRPEDKRAALLHLTHLENQLTSLRLRVMAASDDVAQNDGARDVAAWVAHHARTDEGAERRDLALAEMLDRSWGQVGSALTAGEVNVAQARVIAHALGELPADKISPEVMAQAEAHLVAEAAHFGPRELRVLGRRVLDIVAPEIAEQHEAEALADEEQRAWRRTSLVTMRRGDGTTRIVINVPDAVAARLHTYLEAFTSPRRRGAEGDRVPIDIRRGQAFCDLLEAADPRRLPVHGGDATTLIVTVPLETLRDGLVAAEVGPADRLSAGEVRRLACTAHIIPAVMGAKPEVLDLGRSSRLFKPAQRKAMVVRDRECRAEGCTVPAAWCEAHHAGKPWSQGGRTDLRDGALLCSWHHHRAHDSAYETGRMSNGDLRFSRRT